jgi:type VI secretion system secreted protein VgrG
MDPGDYTQTIYANRTETVKTGDSTFTVETGNEIRHIETDQTQTIGGNQTQEITGDQTEEVTGNVDVTVKGTHTEAVTGAFKSTVTAGITIESKQKIELKVGGNSITIDNSGITIKGIMVETNASGLATHKAGGIMTIKGSMTMIN